jgi:hypothetical protein
MSWGGGSSTPRVGDRVAIIYDPTDQEYVYEDTLMGTWGGSIIPMILGLVFILVSGFFGFVVDAIHSRQHSSIPWSELEGEPRN